MLPWFRPDPERSRILIVGASQFANLPVLPQVEAATARLNQLLLQDPHAPFRHGEYVPHPYSPANVTRPLARAAREATDVLLVYYAGHGVLGTTSQLHLAVESTRTDDLLNSAVALREVYEHLAESSAAVKVLILDCCHSGLALATLPGPLGADSAVLASVRDLGLVDLPPEADYPAVSGDLCDILAMATGTHEPVTLGSLEAELRHRAQRAGRAEIPGLAHRGNVLNLDLSAPGADPTVSAPARRGVDGGPPPETPSRTPDRATTRAVVAGTGALAGGLTVPQVGRALAEVTRALTSNRVGVVEPAHCLRVSRDDLLDTVAGTPAGDLLLVYYAGGAVVDSSGVVVLETSATDPDALWPDGLSLRELLEELREPPEPGGVRVVILDLLVQGTRTAIDWDRCLAPLDGDDRTCLIASATPAATAATGGRFTLFTGELLDVLYNGVRGGSVTASRLAAELERRLDGLTTMVGAEAATVVVTTASAVPAERPSRRPPPTTTSPPQPWWKWWWELLWPWRWLAAAVAVVLVVVGAVVLVRGAGGGGSSCQPPLELRVLASPENATTVREAADQFAVDAANGGCRPYHLTVYSAPVSDVIAGFASAASWAGQPQPPSSRLVPARDIGPQPDAWFADSTADVARAKAAVKAPATLDAGNPLASSPVVLGVPKDATSRFGQLREVTWTTLRTSATNANLQLARPNPLSSAAGLVATMGLYQDAAGIADPSSETAKARVAEVEPAVEAPGYPLNDSTDLLCHEYQASPPAAVIVSEQALVEYNLGKLPSCAGRPTTTHHLAAYYPSDTPRLDLTFVGVHWGRSGDSGARRAALDAFRRWLGRQDGGGAVFAARGYRPAGTGTPGKGSPLTRNESGAYEPAAVGGKPDPNRIAATLASYTLYHSAGRVLFLLDVSGSMSGDDKLARAQAAVDRALDLKNPADIVGVQAVPSSVTNPRDPVTLVPFTTGNLDTVRKAVSGTAPLDEGAALYDALASAVSAIRSPGAPAKQAIVVLTDGDDLSGGRSLSTRTPDALKALAVAGSPVPIQIIAFSPASCQDPRLAQVARDSGGQCLADGNVNQAVARAVGGVWGGG